MKSITFLLTEHMLATSVALPQEQFRAAAHIHQSQARLKQQVLDIKLATVTGGPVETHSGLTLMPSCALSDIETSDITFIPALWRNPQPIIRQNRAILAWLQAQHSLGNIIAGVGTGCCFMAEAGILDNRPATTHWYYFNEFARRYPKVDLRRDHFITQSANLFCAGSVNSLADLTIFFIADLFGEQVADTVERHFFHEVRKNVRRTTRLTSQLNAHPDEDIAQAQSWLQLHATAPISIEQCASALNMPLRSFNRRFKQATNQTPTQYLQELRMEIAADLLKTSNLPVTEVTYKCGYMDQAHFTALFKRHFGVTPSDYRSTVRAKLFSV